MPLPITIFFAAVTGFLAWLSGRLLWRGLRNSLRTIGWMRTTGTVVRCTLVDDAPTTELRMRGARRLDLAVAYTVRGAAYTTSRVSALGDPRDLYYARRTLRAMRRRFAEGARVPVTYDPASPGDALLLRAEPGKLLVVGVFALLFAATAPLLVWAGLTVGSPVRMRETKAHQALERQAPAVLAYVRAHPELGRVQRTLGYWEGGPDDAPPTPLDGDWTYLLETTNDAYLLRAESGRIVDVAVWENAGEPRWLGSLRRSMGM